MNWGDLVEDKSILNTENIVMRPFKIHPPESFRTLPWRNGLGSTVELLLENSTQRKEFSWRLSIASVATGGPFSDFSGYDRRCYYSKGRALRLIILTVPASPLIHRLTALILKVRIWLMPVCMMAPLKTLMLWLYVRFARPVSLLLPKQANLRFK